MSPPLPPGEDFLRAWSATVAAFGNPSSPERRALDPDLLRTCRLSPPALEAALACILHGVRAQVAERLLRKVPGDCWAATDLIVLPSNIPALVLQPLLRSLAASRNALVKSPSAEPHFAPAFVRALVEREPALAARVEVRSWRGGDRAIEDPLLARADRVIAYGDQATIDDLSRRAPGKVWAHGPKTSVAIVATGADLAPTADQISRDVALFDQRGCLSVAAVYFQGTSKDAESFAALLAEALGRRARDWPPGPVSPAAAAAVQHLRLTARLAATPLFPLGPIGAGTVLVSPRPTFTPGPGLRTVSIHSIARLDDALAALRPWRGRLQGVALAGDAEGIDLSALGPSRVAPAGELQMAEASWDDASRPA